MSLARSGYTTSDPSAADLETKIVRLLDENHVSEVGLLKRYPRTGWALAGVPVPESIAEHSFRASTHRQETDLALYQLGLP